LGSRVNVSTLPKSSCGFSSRVRQKSAEASVFRPSATEILTPDKSFRKTVKLNPSRRSTEASLHCSSSKTGEKTMRPSLTAFRISGWESTMPCQSYTVSALIFSLAQLAGNVVKPMAVVKNEPGNWTVILSPSIALTIPLIDPWLLSVGEVVTNSTWTNPEYSPSCASRITRYSLGNAPG